MFALSPKKLAQEKKNGKGLLCFFLLILSLNQANAVALTKESAISGVETPQAFAGCEENALCDKEMGQHLLEWQALLKKLQTPESGAKGKAMSPTEIAREIEKFRASSGLPMEFYSRILAFKQFSPLLWDSPCKIHRHQDKNKQVYVAMSFLKNAQNNQAEIVHKGVLHFIPQGELFQLDPLFVYDPSAKNKAASTQTFFVPHGEIPLVMDQGQLVLPREDEGIYYYLRISAAGKFKVADEKIGTPIEVVEVECDPEVKSLWAGKYSGLFESSYCRELWDVKEKKKKHMLVSWSCQ